MKTYKILSLYYANAFITALKAWRWVKIMAFSLVHFAIIFELLELHMQIFHAEKHIWALFNTATRPVLQALQVSQSKAKLSVTDFNY